MKLLRMFDRVVVIIVGLACVALGLVLMAWSLRTLQWLPLPGAVRSMPDTLQVELVYSNTAWWPWALMIVGIAIIVISLRWAIAHLPSRRVLKLQLPGSKDDATLLVDARSVVDAAALAFNHLPGVDAAVGDLDSVDGQLVARINATLSPDASLQQIGDQADLVSAQLRQVVGRDDLRTTFVLRTVPVRTDRVE